MSQQLDFINLKSEDVEADDAVTVKEAAIWASKYLSKNVTNSQITYLINYGRITSTKKHGKSYVTIKELKRYYDEREETQKNKISTSLSKDINITLSFDKYSESERTKHVHRLHPYKGKFIPQLVEYFLDNHIDDFKKERYFCHDSVVLDPFAGSGTTLVQASEMGIHSVGIELSVYNVIIAKSKLEKYEPTKVLEEGNNLISTLYKTEQTDSDFYRELDFLIAKYNEKYFPSPEYRKKVHTKEIDEKAYGNKIVEIFNNEYNILLKKYNKQHPDKSCGNGTSKSFLRTWFTPSIKHEIEVAKNGIEAINDTKIKQLFMVILGRTVRSCRATKHIDLATLIKPQFTPYYCARKHFKICRPVSTITGHFKKYLNDTIKRVETFSKVRNDTEYLVLEGDVGDIKLHELQEMTSFFDKVGKKKFDGMFTSPPYVGQIDYHDQHMYAYEMFELQRREPQEIGSLKLGKSKKARELYVSGIKRVLKNLKPHFKESANCFIVANDKFELYPTIVKEAGYQLINEFKRPVLNRAEKGKQAYEESIFHIMP